jgi:hypothetical protein
MQNAAHLAEGKGGLKGGDPLPVADFGAETVG